MAHDDDKLAEAYDKIRRARAVLAANRVSAPSKRTVDGYDAKVLLIGKRAGKGAGIDELIAQAKQTRSASTWFSRRAALMYSFRSVIESLLAEQDTLQRSNKAHQMLGRSPDLLPWQRTVKKIGDLTAWHERLRAEPGPAVQQRRPRHSKRRDLRGLPDDWRETVVARMPRYRLAALTSAVTGCRPEELAKGVQLSIEGGMLIATIQGAKVTEKAGQPWRRLCWAVDSDAPLVRALVAEVVAGASLAKVASAKAYSGAMRAAGEREWPKRKTSVTPYCMRHAMAADMKASGMDTAEISAALGHCSDVTKQYYGSAGQGRRAGSVAPASVKAAREVRISPKAKIFQPKRANLPHIPENRG